MTTLLTVGIVLFVGGAIAFVGLNVWIYLQNPKGPDSPP